MTMWFGEYAVYEEHFLPKATISQGVSKILWCGLLPHRFLYPEDFTHQFSVFIFPCYSALIAAYGQIFLISELKLTVAEHTAPAPTGGIPYLMHLFLISAVGSWETWKKYSIFKGFMMSGARKESIPNLPLIPLPVKTPRQRPCGCLHLTWQHKKTLKIIGNTR